MKKYLLLLMIFFAFPASAQLLVNCVQVTNTPCNAASNPGTGVQGDPAWLAFGKINQDLLGLGSGLFPPGPPYCVLTNNTGSSAAPLCGNTLNIQSIIVGTGGAITRSGGHVDADTITLTSVPVNSAADQVLSTTAAATGAWTNLPSCLDSAGNHLNYNTSTHAFVCGNTGGIAASVLFSGVTSATNANALLVSGSFGPTGSGTVTANEGSGAELYINVRSPPYNAVCDGVTNDATAFSTAVAAVNTAWTAGRLATIYIPSGICYLNGPITQFSQSVAGRIVGDGQYHTFIDLGSSFTGPLFSWSEAWNGQHTGGNATPCVHGNASYGFPPNGCTNGAEARDFTITARIASTGQSGLVLYDRDDHVLIENVVCHYLNGPCLEMGITKNKSEAYVRESNFYNVKSWDGGSATGNAIHIGSTTDVGGCDASNELRFYGIDVENAFGDGIVIDTNYTGQGCQKGTDNIMFFGARVEKGASNNDLIRIGGVPITVTSTTNTSGTFSCTNNPCAGTLLVVDTPGTLGAQPGDMVTITGTLSGSGSITGYVSGNVYMISATDNATTFTLKTLAGAAIVTTAGTMTGLKFSLNAGTVYNVFFSGLENTTVPASGFGFHVTSQANVDNNAANNTYGIVVNGYNAVTGTGVGIQIDGGKNVTIKDAKLVGTLSTQLVVGASSLVGCCIYVENLGGTALTTSIDGTSIGSVFTTGTSNANGYSVDLSGNINGNSINTAANVANSLKGYFNFQGGTATSAATWATVSPTWNSAAATLNDTTVGSGGVSTDAAYTIQAPTFTNTQGTANVLTNAETLWLNAPICGAGWASCTNLWALFVNGAARTGALTATGAVTANAGGTLSGGTWSINSASGIVNIASGANASAVHMGDGTGAGPVNVGNSANLTKIGPMQFSNGTTFTVATATGCSGTNGTPGTISGSQQGGKFTGNSSGTTCKFTITPNGATGQTAPNVWACWGSDITSGVLLAQSGNSTTTCSLLGTVNATSDIITFTAIAN